MKALIVTGGSLDYKFTMEYYKTNTFDLVISADSGTEFFTNNTRHPDYVLGDFDSIHQDILNEARRWNDVVFRQYPSEKDYTDTEIALNLAIEKGADEIVILGGTGTRLDHTLATMQLMVTCLSKNISCYILDPHNKMYLKDKDFCLSKEEQYGNYVSLIPFAGTVKGVSLSGFKYDVENVDMITGPSLGVSNQIREDLAKVSFEEGILLVVESRD